VLAAQDIPKEERVLTQFAFQRLLEWLDDGADSEGERYLEIRRRLVAYFDRRNRPLADDLADETLNRVMRSLETGPIRVSPPARYCYVIARFVLLEDIRRERTQRRADTSGGLDLLGTRGLKPADETDVAHALREQRLDCLDRCLDELKRDQRELVLEYYRESHRQRIDRRRELAQKLGISMNALGVRAFRIRDALEACVGQCCGQPGGGSRKATYRPRKE